MGPHVVRYIFNENGNRPVPISLISKFLDRDQYLISAAKMKTHNCVLNLVAEEYPYGGS